MKSAKRDRQSQVLDYLKSLQSASVDELLAEQKRLASRFRWRLAGFIGLGATTGLFVTSQLVVGWPYSISNRLLNVMHVLVVCCVLAGFYSVLGIRNRILRMSAVSALITKRDAGGALQRMLYKVDELRWRPKVQLLDRSHLIEQFSGLELRRLLAVQDEVRVSHLDARSRAVLCDLAANDPISHIKNRRARRQFVAVGALNRREVLRVLQLIHDEPSMTAISRRADLSRAPSIRQLAQRALETFEGWSDDSRTRQESGPTLGEGHEATTIASSRRNMRFTSPRLQHNLCLLLQGLSRSLLIGGRYIPSMCGNLVIVMLIFRDTRSAAIIGLAGAVIYAFKYGTSRFTESGGGRDRLRDELLFLDDPNVLSLLPISDASESLISQPLAGEAISHITKLHVPIISPEKLRSINSFLGGYLRILSKKSLASPSADAIASQLTLYSDGVQRGLENAGVFMSMRNRQEVVQGLSFIGDARTAELLVRLAAATTDEEFSTQCKRAATAINERITFGSSNLLRPSIIAVDEHLVQASQSPLSEPGSDAQLANVCERLPSAIQQQTIMNTASPDA